MQKILRKLLFIYFVLFFYFISAENNVMGLTGPLDYYKSSEVVINLPMQRQIILPLKYVGHGNILEPFQGIKLFIRNRDEIEYPTQDLKTEKNQGFNVAGLGRKFAKVYAKNKLKGLVGDNLDDFLEKLPPFVSWVVEKIVKNGALTPLEECILRGYILYKTPFDAVQLPLKRAEFIALLFKLTITEGQNINELADFFITSEMVNDLLGQDFISFVIDIFESLKNGFIDCDFDHFNNLEQTKPNFKYSVAYVFNERCLAEQCYDLFANKDLSKSDFKKIVAGFVENLKVDSQDIWSPKKYEIVTLDNFTKLQNSSFNFIGFCEDINQISDLISSGVIQKNNSSNVEFISWNDKYYILLKTKQDNSNLYKTIKLLMASLYRAFQDYRAIANINEFEHSPLNYSVSKQNLADIIITKQTLQREISRIDARIKECRRNKVRTKGVSFWNNFFSNNKQEELEELLHEKADKERQLKAVSLKLKNLNLGLYYFNEPLQLQEKPNKGVFEIVTDMFLNNPKVNNFIQNINEDPKYKKVKENLIKRLAVIFNKSENIKEYWEVIEYILSNLFPNYKNDFRLLTEELNENNINQIGDRVLPLI